MPPPRKTAGLGGRPGPPLGAHVSVAGGLASAFDRALRVGAEVIQIFSKHSTRWAGKELAADEARAFREAGERSGVRAVAVHCAYLLNLGSADPLVRRRSLYALEDEAARAAMLGVPYLVMHPGSCGADPAEVGIARVGKALCAFGRFPAGVTLLLENTAGQGSSLGRTMEQLRRILDACGNPPDVGICLDSAHLFQAGYDIAGGAGFEAMIGEAERFGIAGLVRLWHLNDSKTGRGSRVDRHEHIGEGGIGLPAFRRIVSRPEHRALPMIIETPKDGADEFERDIRNLAALRALRGPA